MHAAQVEENRIRVGIGRWFRQTADTDTVPKCYWTGHSGLDRYGTALCPPDKGSEDWDDGLVGEKHSRDSTTGSGRR
jgi:hypothetical protein